MFEIKEIRHFHELEVIKGEWQFLVDNSDYKSVFMTYEWVSTWLKHFWKDKPILFLLGKIDNVPIGLAPFLIDRGKNRLIFPVNNYSYRPNLIVPSKKEEFLKALFYYLKKIKAKLYLEQVEVDSPLTKLLPVVSKSCNLVTIFKKSFDSPFLSIKTDWQNYLKAKSSHFCHEQKRKLNKIKMAGKLDFLKVSNADQCNSAMEDILNIEQNSWKEKAGTSFTASSGVKEFYLDLAKMCVKDEWLCIYLLYLDSIPLAYIYGLIYNNKYYALKTSYHETYKDLSPGAVLFNYALRDAFQSFLKEFDFLGIESRWKNEFASNIRRHMNIAVYPGNISYRYLQYHENTLKPFIKQKAPFLLSLKRLRGAVKRNDV